MKKTASVILAGIMAVSLAACGHTTKTNVSSATQEPTSTASVVASVAASSSSVADKVQIIDAESVVNALVDAGLPIDNIIVYTEETDENELLGRPNQYTSKVNFADTREEQHDAASPVGGSVEVFDNKDDADARYTYVDAISKSSSMFSQYIYLTDNVLLRIDGALTPTQAKEYQVAFDSLMGVE